MARCERAGHEPHEGLYVRCAAAMAGPAPDGPAGPSYGYKTYVVGGACGALAPGPGPPAASEPYADGGAHASAGPGADAGDGRRVDRARALGLCVTLREAEQIIAAGTTGLVTWGAALRLAEWALAHRDTFAGRRVVELGAGCGLAGLCIAKAAAPAAVVFTDCHPLVLDALRENLRINGLAPGPAPDAAAAPEGDPRRPPSTAGPAVPREGEGGGAGGDPCHSGASGAAPCAHLVPLDWHTATALQLRALEADVVVAADVVYDPAIIDDLVRTIKGALAAGADAGMRAGPGAGARVAYVASTVRHTDTLEAFRRRAEEAGLSVRDRDMGSAPQVFHFDRTSAVVLHELRLGPGAL